jgi:predicted  nucleic acid-binding Zn-ribbon protein
MKSDHLLIILAAAAIASGCNKDSTTYQQMDRVQAKTDQAAQDMKGYTYAQKAQFVDYMQGQLNDLNREMDELAVNVEKSSAAAKAEARPRVQALRDQIAGLSQQLDAVRNSTESSWDNVKVSANKAFNDAKDGFNQARKWLSDKIAP